MRLRGLERGLRRIFSEHFMPDLDGFVVLNCVDWKLVLFFLGTTFLLIPTRQAQIE